MAAWLNTRTLAGLMFGVAFGVAMGVVLGPVPGMLMGLGVGGMWAAAFNASRTAGGRTETDKDAD